MKEDFFSRFKDYNKELEKVLEHKEFSQDAKNILLSMFYKLEAAYQDYFTVKRHCVTKQEYLENIIENIKYINSIQVISKENINLEDKQKNKLYVTDVRYKIIKVIGNEFAMLSALLYLNDFEVHLNEKHFLIRNSMNHFLNTAYEMENIEVLRDFNAWSWNTVVEEIRDININLIYQNLRIALNTNLFSKAEQNNIDIIELIQNSLLNIYNKDVVEKLLELIFKISIMIYIKLNENERNNLIENRRKLQLYLNKINDKKSYIEAISEDKKKLTDQLRKIDLTLNNKELLLQEYHRRNQQVASYNKIFNISHMVEILQAERVKVLGKIETCNKRVDPKNYLEDKNKLEKEYNLIKDINLEGNNDIYKYINQLQAIFIKYIFLEKVKVASTRNELIDCMYELRYYKFLPYTNEKKIKDIEYFKNYIEEVEELLIKKLFDNKIINTISTSLENDIKILKSIFNLKIINMEQIYIKIQKRDSAYILQIYDGKETLEEEKKIDIEFNKKHRIKLNKKIKLFI